MASWRCPSALTAAVYSSLPSTRLTTGMSSTDLGSRRVSRGGIDLRTEARPEPAARTWVPMTSA
ncbi:hypothetical protein DMA10_27925 [Streptomyces sp. WAC 01420]|nr:hypothetical protein DLM49_09315 [Streptomyces sp. WAC 01438]RSM91036.1 hypothetical protein DMA10_27925 [Streptomyces sp. WAC 01420]